MSIFEEKFPMFFWGAPLAQLVECQTLDHKVAGLNLTRGTVLCH